MTRRILPAALATLALLVLAGCTGASPTGSEVDENQTEIELPPIDLENLTADAVWSYYDSYQQAIDELEGRILEDGEVTEEEYERSKLFQVACMEMFGQPMELWEHADGTLGLNGIAREDDDPELTVAILSVCTRDIVSLAEERYREQLGLLPERNANQAIADCLVEVGFVDAPFDRFDLQRAELDTEFAQRLQADPDAAECLG